VDGTFSSGDISNACGDRRLNLKGRDHKKVKVNIKAVPALN
jgi:hypothetical protein